MGCWRTSGTGNLTLALLAIANPPDYSSANADAHTVPEPKEISVKDCIAIVLLLLVCASVARAQAPELKFIADTLVVQADGTYEADPDLATMTFRIFSQEKELKRAYDAATQSMQRISTLAANNGLKKEDVSSGVLTVAPIYEGDPARPLLLCPGRNGAPGA